MSESRHTVPLISVVVTTHKRPKVLARAMRSVLKQSLRDFELIVVDDASGDDTEQTVASFSDYRVRYVRHETNRGVAAARNSGTQAARAPMVAFLDDDDEYLPSYLEKMSGRLSAAPEGVGFVFCGVREVYQRGGVVGSRDVIAPPYAYRNSEEAYRAFLRRLPSSGWFVTARKSAVDAVGGFDESIRIEDERDLLHRLVRRYTYDVEPTVLAHHYFHDQAHLNVYGPKVSAAYRHLTTKNHEALYEDRDLWSDWHYKLGWLHYQTGEPALGRRYLWTALRRSPLHLRAWWALLSYQVLGSRAPAVHAALSRTVARARLARTGSTRR